MQCETCANAIFNEIWGEYFCPIRDRIIYPDNAAINCEDHKKGEPRISKKEDSEYV